MISPTIPYYFLKRADGFNTVTQGLVRAHSPNSSAVGVLAVLLFNVPEIFKIWPADPTGGCDRPPALSKVRVGYWGMATAEE